MKWRLEDPEVLAVLVVVLAFVACLFTLRPDRELLDRAIAAHEKRVQARIEARGERPMLKGLVMALPFDGNVKDLIGQDRVLREVGITFAKDGRHGKAARFSPRKYLWCDPVRITTEGTWAFWMRIGQEADLSREQRLMTANGYGLTLDGQLRMHFHDNRVRRIAAPAPGKGAWTHVAMTWQYADEKGSIQLYVNGRSVGKQPYSGQPTWQNRTLGIGVSYKPPDFGFNGDLDDICVYDRALTPAELKLLMEKGITFLHDNGHGDLLPPEYYN